MLGRHQLKFGGEFRYGISDVENPLGGHQLRRTYNSRATSPRCGRTSARSPWPTAATPSRRSCSATWRRTPTTCSPIFDWRSSYGGLFVQDDWRHLEPPDAQRSACDGTTNRRSRSRAIRSMPGSIRTRSRSCAPPVRRRACRARCYGGLTLRRRRVLQARREQLRSRASASPTGDETRSVVRGGYGLTFLDSSTDRGTSTGFTRTTPYVASLDATARRRTA